MRDPGYHTADRGRVNTRHDLVEPLETETFDNQLMLPRRRDGTPVVFDPDTGVRALGGFCFRCHHFSWNGPHSPNKCDVSYPIASAASAGLFPLKRLDRLPAQPGDRCRFLQSPQPVESSLYNVVRIGTSQRLGQNIGNAGGLNHGPDGPSGDDSRPLRSRLKHDSSGAEAPDYGVGNSPSFERDPDQVFPGLLDAFPNRLGNFFRFSHAITNQAVLIADDNESAEAQVLSPFYDLGNAVYGDDLILQFHTACVNSVQASPCNSDISGPAAVTCPPSSLLELESTLTSGLGQSLNPPVIEISPAIKDHRFNPSGYGPLCNHFPDRLGGRNIARMWQVGAYLFVQRGSRDKSLPLEVIDNLSVNVVQASVDTEARPPGVSKYLSANSSVNPGALPRAIERSNHQAPFFPTFSRTTSLT